MFRAVRPQPPSAAAAAADHTRQRPVPIGLLGAPALLASAAALAADSAMPAGSNTLLWALGGVAVGCLLTLLGRRLLARTGPAAAFLLGVVASVSITGIAAQLSLPNRFENGQVADADQVNENFDALAAESNAQDLRIVTLEDERIPRSENPLTQDFIGVPGLIDLDSTGDTFLVDPSGVSLLNRVQTNALSDPNGSNFFDGGCLDNQYLAGISDAGAILCQANSADITEVLPGTGLSGGGTAGSVTLNISAGGVSNALLANNSVTGAKVVDGTINSLDVQDGGITDIDIASLNAAKLTGVLSEARLPQGAIDGTEIQDDSIGSVDIINGSLTSDDIATNGIVDLDIASLNAAKLTGTISESRLPQGAIDGSEIQNGSVTGADIAANTITNANIADNSIIGADLNSAVFTISSTTLLSASGSNSDRRITLGSLSSRFCFLAGMQVNDVDGGSEFARCLVFASGSTWVLDSDVRSGDDNDVTCYARCITW